MHALKNRVGFALPLVVIFMVVLSFALAAGLAATARWYRAIQLE